MMRQSLLLSNSKQCRRPFRPDSIVCRSQRSTDTAVEGLKVPNVHMSHPSLMHITVVLYFHDASTSHWCNIFSYFPVLMATASTCRATSRERWPAHGGARGPLSSSRRRFCDKLWHWKLRTPPRTQPTAPCCPATGPSFTPVGLACYLAHLWLCCAAHFSLLSPVYLACPIAVEQTEA